ncbi:MAG: hypothetical protein UR69_C0002G0079 [Candidatus Moranbacteria bacterium GW2011_GWE2_35_2-]|nr:MAG: hypothetical protein UR69_C0002G0079 [Candidatus Moranbacteria bacterium GW2011_GWE2_35_2-]KKQ05010.1 MAG: hypothetical protein US15_C0037G0007 [Candidatus Moranbacteria bacterium GW2011_GWF1_36_4]KKQ22572.1 MAG: hypothetical protein US37_C0002G0197 [Candidatus Moranbacteria bacterium GW2011_GWF2_37_11]KKQ28975.1 MAG: hypothetical protein US44_C0004G0019 [Candidatus Moranbacteria bacterium GW2011_GWD1_37_17]KKQ30489.1 MAG: hypothetical protein US47_C0002G0079 [Candidatus Moranbacteria b
MLRILYVDDDDSNGEYEYLYDGTLRQLRKDWHTGQIPPVNTSGIGYESFLKKETMKILGEDAPRTNFEAEIHLGYDGPSSLKIGEKELWGGYGWYKKITAESRNLA